MPVEVGKLFGAVFRRSKPAIDLGGGRLVAPEDLLEGHFRRLAGAPPLEPRDTVRVQTTPSLNALIQVAAPTLAPLTQIAEQLATKLPTLQPAADFRSQLHHALEEEHRRRLQNPPAPAPARTRWPIFAAFALATLGAATLVLWLARRRARQRPF